MISLSERSNSLSGRLADWSAYGLFALSVLIVSLLIRDTIVQRVGVGSIAHTVPSQRLLPPPIPTRRAISEPYPVPTAAPVPVIEAAQFIWTGSFWADCAYIGGDPRGQSYDGPADANYSYWTALSLKSRYQIGKDCEGR